MVLFSGGQDSTVCLAWALARFGHVETLGFDYGQRHAVELAQRRVVLDALKSAFPDWANLLGEDHVLALPTLAAISDTSLTRDAEITMTAAGLPSTFVPGRNVLFFTYAAAVAYRRGIRDLIGGMCETDFSGYPDCRDATLKSLQTTLRLGTEVDFTIHTPLMWLDKAETWALAGTLGGDALTALILEHTHTCYRGDRTIRHVWGYGCGACPACDLRAKGYQRWQAQVLSENGVKSVPRS